MTPQLVLIPFYKKQYGGTLRRRPPKHITAPGLSGVAGVKNGGVILYLVQSPRS